MESKFQEFCVIEGEIRVNCACTLMKSSCYIWCGLNNDNSMKNLTVSLPSRFDSVSIASKVIDSSDESSDAIDFARVLSTKFKISGNFKFNCE